MRCPRLGRSSENLPLLRFQRFSLLIPILKSQMPGDACQSRSSQFGERAMVPLEGVSVEFLLRFDCYRGQALSLV